MDHKTAIVTGSASGIGKELGRLLAENGYRLFLVNLNARQLEDTAREFERQYGIDAHVIVQDLSLPDAAQHIFDRLKHETVDVLINNAGFGVRGNYATTDWEKEYRMIMVHTVALSQLTKLFLPGMINRKKGRIMNVASMAAFQPGPLMAIYYATKAYTLSFSQAIAAETKGTGVTVTALCPGMTKTGFQKTIGSDHSVFRESMWMSDATEVAAYGYKAMMKGRTLAVPGMWNQLLVSAQRLLPRNIVTRAVFKAQEKVERGLLQ